MCTYADPILAKYESSVKICINAEIEERETNRSKSSNEKKIFFQTKLEGLNNS